jgi:hypothetical protein
MQPIDTITVSNIFLSLELNIIQQQSQLLRMDVKHGSWMKMESNIKYVREESFGEDLWVNK